MDNIITVRNENGTKDFIKLLEFSSTKTNKDYVLYVENTDNEDAKLEIMCSIIKKESNGIKLLDLESDDDFIECNNAMKIYLENLKTNL